VEEREIRLVLRTPPLDNLLQFLSCSNAPLSAGVAKALDGTLEPSHAGEGYGVAPS
jgi:hypothetical protein